MGNMLNRSPEEREKIRRNRLKEYLARLSTETAASSLSLNLIQDLLIALSYFKHDDHIVVTSREKGFSHDRQVNAKRPILTNQQPDRGSLIEGRSNDLFKRVPQHQDDPHPFTQTSVHEKKNINFSRKDPSIFSNPTESIFSPRTQNVGMNPQPSKDSYEYSFMNKEPYGSNYRNEFASNAKGTESVYNKDVLPVSQYQNVPALHNNPIERPSFSRNYVPTYVPKERQDMDGNPFKFETNRPYYNENETLGYNTYEKPTIPVTKRPTFNQIERPGYNKTDQTTLFTNFNPSNSVERPSPFTNNRPAFNSKETFSVLNKNEKFSSNTRVKNLFNSKEKDSKGDSPGLSNQIITGKTYGESKESPIGKDKQYTTFEPKPYSHFYNQPKPQAPLDRTANEPRANRHQSMDPPQNLQPRRFQPSDTPNFPQPSLFNQPPSNIITRQSIYSKRNQSMDPPQNSQPRNFQNFDTKSSPQFPGVSSIHQSREPTNPPLSNPKFPSLRSQPAQASEKPVAFVDQPSGFHNISAGPPSNPIIMNNPQNPPTIPTTSSKFSIPPMAVPNKAAAITETRIKPVPQIQNLCYYCKKNEPVTDDCEHKSCKPCLKSAFARVSNGTFLGRLHCSQCSTEIQIDRHFSSNEFKEKRLQSINYLRTQCIIDVTSAHFSCIICNEEVLVSESITLSCEHRSCEPCICKFVTEKIQTNSLSEIKCPQCDAPIDYNVISNITDKATLDQYEKFSTRSYEPLAKNAVAYWCPYCNSVYEIDKNLEKFVCKGCNKEICVKCNSEHPGISCKEYLKAGKANLGDYKYIVCPGCNEAIEPGDGCNFYACKYPGCCTSFCKLCGKVLDEKQHHSHFKTFGPFGNKCNTLEGIPDEI